MNRVSLTTFVTSAAHWSPGQAPVPPMGATAWPCRPGARLSETVIAFACSCSCGIETPVAFTGAGRALTETAIAFAGVGRASAETVVAFAVEKWAFWVCFSVAEVMVVSMVAVQGRAVVLLVSMPLCCCASCAKKFALLGLMVGVSAKKFAQRTKNGPKWAFSGVLGELFRGNAAGGAALGEFFRGNAAGGAVLGEFFRANRPCARSCRRRGALQAGCGGGFAALEAGWLCVVGVSYL